MASPARILFVHYGDDWVRGSEQCLIDLIDGLDRTRFEPIIRCNSRALTEALAIKGYEVERFDFKLLFNWDFDLSNVVPYFRMVREAGRLLRERRIDLVHCNSGAPAQWMIPACRSQRVPMLSHIHCTYSKRERVLLGLHQAPLMVGVSRAVLRDFLADGFPLDRTKVIYNGVDPRRIDALPQPGLRRDLGLPDGTLVVTSVGSLVHHKGHDLLIRALDLLKRSGEPIHAIGIIAGDGPDRQALERLAAELAVDIRFLGYRRDVGALLKEVTDVLALASRRDAMPLVLLEAAHFGRAMVACSVDGVPEVIVDGETGLLVPPDDPLALANALRRLLSDPRLRARFGDAARWRMQQHFTAKAMIGAFEETYTELLRCDRRSWGWLGTWNSWKPYANLLVRSRPASVNDHGAVQR